MTTESRKKQLALARDISKAKKAAYNRSRNRISIDIPPDLEDYIYSLSVQHRLSMSKIITGLLQRIIVDNQKPEKINEIMWSISEGINYPILKTGDTC